MVKVGDIVIVSSETYEGITRYLVLDVTGEKCTLRTSDGQYFVYQIGVLKPLDILEQMYACSEMKFDV